MLWSDPPPHKPSELLRAAQNRLRRVGWVIATVVVFVLLMALSSRR
ncbi:hypothetical protein GL263_10520 [Streptomyces durbertensis]|uniref:Uncharacterized protein n=1 Tax=Streptomyces durbertensis TaxID=2448886 RepID=A0ABR6EF94_9ACTN|nr:hypothetical protein [Streptomyces durbertensis]MBB1243987.1 hypothetical protein [Streptomyces durbertensis]